MSAPAAYPSNHLALISGALTRHWALVALTISLASWLFVFTGLVLTRHWALGTHAEDLGFTDQVIWNTLHGRPFHMTVYTGGSWNTEIDIASIPRPNSLLAFHVEPMLLAFVPTYALGGGPTLLLLVQTLAYGLGVIPLYFLTCRWTSSPVLGLAMSLVWLFSPLGQWALLSDFHTTVIAASLLLWSAERYAAGRIWQAVILGLLAASAREDAAIAAAGLGFIFAVRGRWRAGLLLSGLSCVWALLGVMFIMRWFTGGSSPFAARYPALLDGPSAMLAALSLPSVEAYFQTIALNGGWLALLSPLTLLPLLAMLALNVFSSSHWMQTGRAHYSALVLPFIVIGAIAGAGELTKFTRTRWPTLERAVVAVLALIVVGGSGLAYARAGSGPGAAEVSSAVVTPHADIARAIARMLPPEARVSASSALYPLVSQRESVYVFPAVNDADYLFIDVVSGAAPTSPGDVFLHVQSFLESGEWSVQAARDGVLVLNKVAPSPGSCLSEQCFPADFFSFLVPGMIGSPGSAPIASYLDGALDLVSAETIASPFGDVAPDGPRGVLRTYWRANTPLQDWAWPAFSLRLTDGSEMAAGDLAALWWFGPERWPVGGLVQLDVPSVPLQRLADWSTQVDQPDSHRVEPG